MDNHEKRQKERISIQTGVEFFVDADIINATSVNISETGVRFTTNDPIKILMRMDVDGKVIERKARLVWVATAQDGGMDYGFEFLPDPETDQGD